MKRRRGKRYGRGIDFGDVIARAVEDGEEPRLFIGNHLKVQQLLQ